MSFNKFVLIIAIFLTSLTVNSFALNNSSLIRTEHKSICKYFPEDDGYVLEFIDGRWWWVLYGTDGQIINKIPYDL